MELHKTLVLDPNSAATSPNGSSTPTSATPVTSATSPTIQSPQAPLTMPISIPAMKHYQVIGMNGMGGLPGINGLSAGISGSSLTSAGLTTVNGLNAGLPAMNVNGYSVLDPMLLTNGFGQALPQQASSFTGKVRVGVAAVKTGSPKFAPY